MTFTLMSPVVSSRVSVERLTSRLGRRTTAQMRRRKFQIILVGCLLTMLAVWVLRSAREGTGDEHRYRQMLRAEVWGWRLNSAEKRLPGPLVRLLHIANLKKTYMGKAQAHEEALLASGYLTNASITITNLPPTATKEKSRQAEVLRRLRTGLRGVDSWFFYMKSNQAVITCRSSDVPLIRRAIESP